MTRGRHRRLHYWLTLVAGITAAASWASNAVKAVVFDAELSTRGLFASLAFTLTGLALGMVLGILTAEKRAKQREREQVADTTIEDLRAPFLLLALMLIGGGVDPVFDTSVGPWGWTSLIGGSLVGGLLFAAVLVAQLDKGQVSRGSNTYVQPPTRHDWR